MFDLNFFMLWLTCIILAVQQPPRSALHLPSLNKSTIFPTLSTSGPSGQNWPPAPFQIPINSRVVLLITEYTYTDEPYPLKTLIQFRKELESQGQPSDPITFEQKTQEAYALIIESVDSGESTTRMEFVAALRAMCTLFWHHGGASFDAELVRIRDERVVATVEYEIDGGLSQTSRRR